ncbi:MAG TPA: InlB B-repeat-containing protein [Candidatus Alectryocaccobium stercorigallinarum]|nr:InlB B-repeat-containing protein [Candidatus Alectryocaccobium stercorigallinarum]
MIKRNKILAAILIPVLSVCGVSGIVLGVKAANQKPVMVISATELNYGGGWNTSEMQGVITSDVSQDVYLTETQTVSEVLIKEGDVVKEGDVLLVYDTTLTSLNLEREKLSRQQIELNIQAAQENLKKLQNTKPVPEGGGSTDDPGFIIPDDPGFIIPDDPGLTPDVPAEPTPTPEPTPEPVSEFKIVFHSNGHGKAPEAIPLKKDSTFQEYIDKLKPEEQQAFLPTEEGYVFGGWYTDQICTVPFDPEMKITEDIQLYAKWTKAAPDYSGVKAYDKLTAEALAYNMPEPDSDEAIGTVLNPYRYLCTDKAVITSEFMNSLRKNATELLKENPDAHYYFMFEVHEGNTVAGKLQKAWISDATLLTQEFPENWQGTVDLASGTIDVGVTDPDDNDPDVEAPDTEDPDTDNPDAETPGTETPGSNEPGTENPDTDTPETGATNSTNTASAAALKLTVSPTTMSGAEAVLTASSSGLITGDVSYTKDELASAIREQEEALKNLQLDLKESDLKIQQAAKAVEDGVVRAKLNGIVKKAGDPHNPPTDGSPFLQVNSTEGLYVKGGISELRLNELKEGDTVSVMSWQSGAMCEAVVQDISPYPDESGMFSYGESTSYYPFTAYIDTGAEGFTSQEWVSVTLLNPSIDQASGSGALYLWKAFIREEAGEKYVYKRDENGRLMKQTITVGQLSGSGYEIISGVTWDDWLAFPYGNDVKDGAETREGTVNELYGY